MITVLTPTYNRSYSLPRLYQSLVKQSKHDFEWLVIDDGSLDDTENLIKGYQLDSPFNIRYFKKNNGGKHSALNLGFKKSNNEWIFIVDSDDWLEKNCIEYIKSKITDSGFNYDSISFLRSYETGEIIGDKYTTRLDGFIERGDQCIKGDKADIFRKSKLLGFSFPEFDGERFMAESPLYLWYGKRWSTFFSNYSGYICEYQPDGLSSLSLKNRYLCKESTSFVYHYQWTHYSTLKRRIPAAINWWRFRKLSSRNTNWRPPLIYIFPALLLVILDSVKLLAKEK